MVLETLFTSRSYPTESDRIAQVLQGCCYSTCQKSSGVPIDLMVNDIALW